LALITCVERSVVTTCFCEKLFYEREIIRLIRNAMERDFLRDIWKDELDGSDVMFGDICLNKI